MGASAFLPRTAGSHTVYRAHSQDMWGETGQRFKQGLAEAPDKDHS